MDQYKAVGEFIRQRRQQLKMTQSDVVEALSKMGLKKPVSDSSYGRLELGQTGPSFWGDADFIHALATVLRVSVDEIMVLTGHLAIEDDTFRTKRLAKMLAALDRDALDAVEEIVRRMQKQENDGQH